MADSTRVAEAFALARRLGVTNVRSYQEATGESFASPDDALAHYLHQGRSASQSLFPFFDTVHYQAQLSGALPASTTYFEHYVIEGARLGLTPTPFFDLAHIAQQVDGAQPESLLDFLSDHRFRVIDPHVMFSKSHYKAIYVDIDNAGVDPFGHFLAHGWREKRATHPFFRPEDYGRFGFPDSPDVADFNRRFMAVCNEPALAQTQPMFDVSHYSRALGPDGNIANPLQHFLNVGWRDGISPFPLFDIQYFLNQTGESPPRRNPYVDYLSDLSHRYAPSRSFDPAYYLATMPEAAKFRGSLLEHFVRFGAAKGARPHRSVTVLRTYPSQRSGLEVVVTLRDAAGRDMWFCTARKDEWLAAQLDDIADIEPSLSRRILDQCELNPYTGPIDQASKTLIEIMVRIARCHCVVVSEAGLDEWLVDRMAHSAADLVSHARPWLTLLSAGNPTVQYWHAQRGAGSSFDTTLPGDTVDKAHMFAQALLTSLPERLVIRTDGLGVALLRRCGTALLTAIPEVSLLCDDAELDARDRRWLAEFTAAHFADFAAVLTRGESLAGFGAPAAMHDAGSPRVVEL